VHAELPRRSEVVPDVVEEDGLVGGDADALEREAEKGRVGFPAG